MNLEDIKLRPAAEGDFDFLLDLRRTTMEPHLVRQGIELNQQIHIDRIQDKYEFIKIIEHQNQSIGMIKSYSKRNGLVISQVQLLPELQNKGIGSKVIGDVLAEAKKDGLMVSLRVLKNNPAQKLYERLGFTKVSEGQDENSFSYQIY